MNATLKLEWNDKTYTCPAHWEGGYIIVDEKVIDDIYGGGEMEDEWDTGNHPNFTIIHDETGQTSRATFDDEIWELYSHEELK